MGVPPGGEAQLVKSKFFFVDCTLSVINTVHVICHSTVAFLFKTVIECRLLCLTPYDCKSCTLHIVSRIIFLRGCN